MSNNAISAITIRGFKSIAAIENLKLGPLNVVIGANGSGKSNFVRVFSFLTETVEASDRFRDRVSVAGGANCLLHFGVKRTQAIEILLSGTDDPTAYRVKLVPTTDDRLLFANSGEDAWNLARFPGGMNSGRYLDSARLAGAAEMACLPPERYERLVPATPDRQS